MIPSNAEYQHTKLYFFLSLQLRDNETPYILAANQRATSITFQPNFLMLGQKKPCTFVSLIFMEFSMKVIILTSALNRGEQSSPQPGCALALGKGHLVPTQPQS
jgi:hypothetical protein